MRAFLLALLGYVLLTLAFTFPAVLQLRTAMFGGGWDGPMFLWNLWWGPHALFELHRDPLVTDHLFHPLGASLVVNTHCLAPALASWPLQKLVGLVTTYDLMVLLTFVLSGLGAYFFAYDLTKDRRAAFVAGAVFAFGHLRVSKILFFNLIQSELLIFWAWALWRTVDRRSCQAWMWAAIAGVLGAATFWTDYNLAVFAGLWGACFGVAALVTSRRDGGTRAAVLARLVGVVVVLGALCLPLARRLSAEWKAAGEYEAIEESDSFQEATPIARFLVWNDLGGRTLADPPTRQAAFLGYATLLLAGYGLWKRRKEPLAKFLLFMSAAFLLLALGPELNLGSELQPSPDQALHVPLPYRFVRSIPVLGEIRVAHRFGIVAWMAIALAAGLGAAELLKRARTPKRANLLTALACTAVMVDFARPPFPKLAPLPPTPPAFEAVRDDPRDVVVVEWPGGRLGDPCFAWYETLHRKPVYLEGSVARTTDDVRAAQQESKLFRLLRRLFLDDMFKDGEPERDGKRFDRLAKEAREEAREQKVGWIVLSQVDRDLNARRREPFTREELERANARLRQAFPGAKRVWKASDEQIELFRHEPLPGELSRWSVGGLDSIWRLEWR
jgi:hypothetical protein